ncbi:MAG: hypothetical protein LAT68_05680, partial [Cyclobacteriaceae bacterium]|nr:hypothetical protein [Cyclobacteriaceae bacterium]
MRHLILISIFILASSFYGYAQDCSGNDVIITQPDVVDLCPNESGFETVGDITIQEPGDNNNAINGENPSSFAVILELPDGLQFRRTGNSVGVTSTSDITLSSKNVQSNAIFLFLNGNTSVQDDFTITGIEVRNVDASAGTFNITASVAIGCVQGLEVATVAQVEVKTAPANPTFAFDEVSNDFCLGEDLEDTFSSDFISVSGTGLLYFKDEGLTNEIASASGLSNPSASQLELENNAGTQTVWVTSSVDGCLSEGVRIDFNVIASPNLDFTSADFEFCGGESVLIDLRDFSSGASNFDYTVSGDNIGLSDGSGDLIFFNAPANNTAGASNLTATLEVTAIFNGCEVTEQVDVTIKTAPRIRAFSTPVEVCDTRDPFNINFDEDFNITVDNNVSGTFTFAGPGMDSDGVTFDPDGFDDGDIVELEVTYTRDDGCQTSRFLELIRINASPIVTIDEPEEDTEFCAGGQIIFSTEETSTTSRTWTADPIDAGTFVNAGVQNPTFNINPNFAGGPVIFTVVTNDPGLPCSAGNDEITLNILERVTADAGDNLEVCGDGTLALSGIVTGDLEDAFWELPTGVEGTLSDEAYDSGTGEVT